MNSHIAITAQKNGKQIPLVLPDDFSIDIDDQNPLFNENEMFSYPVRMPMEGNRFLLGNIDDPANIDRPVSLEHTKMRIAVDNQPFRSGTLVTSEDEELDGALTMNITASEHSIDDLIGTLSCRDIPLKDKILIGEKIGDVTASLKYKYHVQVKFEGKKGDINEYPSTAESAVAVFTPQALGFSYPGECYTTGTKEQAIVNSVEPYADNNAVNRPKVKRSYINVSEAYPSAKYCNARVAYYHHGIDEDGKKTADSIDPITKKTGHNKHWPYWVLDADRQQSGICFYVLYFLDCLFSYLGVSFDNSELMKVDDMRRLCFFTTHCKYDEEHKYPNRSTPFFTDINDINNWLSSRGCGGSFEFHDGQNMQVNSVDYVASDGQKYIANVGTDGVSSITVFPSVTEHKIQANIMLMYANSDNFPDESVTTIIDSLFASFGIKFEYNYEKKHVRAYFVREVFRSQEEPIDFPGKVISMHKVAEKITGVRMCYSEESTSKEQKANVRQGVKDYNTDYDYIDYPKKSTITDKTYNEIFRAPQQNNASGNMNVYIDKKTGNAYRIKVNSDAEKAQDLKPVLFEVGQYKGVELGDCSELNEDFVEEISSDFQPMVFNDVNYQQEIATASGSYKSDGQSVILNPQGCEPILAAFIDEDMEHEFIEQRIRQNLASNICEYSIDMVIKLEENYDPSGTEDGNSPLQSIDWGLAIAIMRGGGTNATYQIYDYNYDGFGNSKWRSVAGLYALTSDSIDMWGNEYDYNGTQEGIGNGERFSLKIRAWKQPEWADAPLIDADVINSSTGEVEKKIKSRGLFDTFLSEYAHFILKRRKYTIRIECSAAQVADVPNHWERRFRINGLVGFINKLSYSVSAKDGLQDLIVEFFVV